MAIYKSNYTGAQIDALLSQVPNKQDKLTAGNGISIDNNVISVSLNFSLYEIVSELPASGQDRNKIYLKLSDTSGSQNKYTEYLWTGSEWEILGEFTVSGDLSNYVTKGEFTTLSASVTENTNSIANLQSAIDPIVNDPNYEVMLFKKA